MESFEILTANAHVLQSLLFSTGTAFFHSSSPIFNETTSSRIPKIKLERVSSKKSQLKNYEHKTHKTPIPFIFINQSIIQPLIFPLPIA